MPCAKFSPSMDYVGINFGTGVHEFSAVAFSSDGGCNDRIEEYTQPGSGQMGCTNTTAFPRVGNVAINQVVGR